jgi:hypothetical protein
MKTLAVTVALILSSFSFVKGSGPTADSQQSGPKILAEASGNKRSGSGEGSSRTANIPADCGCSGENSGQDSHGTILAGNTRDKTVFAEASGNKGSDSGEAETGV